MTLRQYKAIWYREHLNWTLAMIGVKLGVTREAVRQLSARGRRTEKGGHR